MKICSTCKVKKPKSEFQVRKASKDGLTASCKECLKKRDSARYTKEKDRRAIWHKKYMKTDKGKMAHRAASRAWDQKNPVRVAAQTALGNAVRDGKVTKLPCFVCGSLNSQGHHPDYGYPLSVIWLCPQHHKDVHNLI